MRNKRSYPRGKDNDVGMVGRLLASLQVAHEELAARALFHHLDDLDAELDVLREATLVGIGL